MWKRIFAVMLAALCICASAWAVSEYSPGYLDEPPHEVWAHLDTHFSDYTLEDYCEIRDTSKGDFGFAMILKGRERILLGYHREEGAMKYWLKNANAVPQGKEEAWFSKGTAGWYPEDDGFYTDGRVSQKQVFDDGLWFSVTRLDDARESYEKSVSYRWKNGGFKLTGYKHYSWLPVQIEENALLFFDNTIPKQVGTVQGGVQTDLRYVSYSTLPKDIDEARGKLTRATGEAFGPYPPQKIKFTGGGKYPVYTGPGKHYARSGDGKGQVSTNDWIEVYGQKDGYILIQYGINSKKNRIGWIDAKALPKGELVPEIEFYDWENSYVISENMIGVTDDPFRGQETLARLTEGMKFDLLLVADDEWCYIEFEENGKRMCGFLPFEAI